MPLFQGGNRDWGTEKYNKKERFGKTQTRRLGYQETGIFLLFLPNACMNVQSLSRVRLFVTPWTIACKVPLTMGFSRQEYWNELPNPPPGDLPNPGIKPMSPALQVDSLPLWSAAAAAAAAAKSLQSCPTLCDPIDGGNPIGCPIPGILQARTLEWVAISFSNAGKWKVKVKSLSRVRLLATPCTAAYQAPPSMGFSRQEYCSGVPLSHQESPYKGGGWGAFWRRAPSWSGGGKKGSWMGSEEGLCRCGKLGS